MEVRILRLSESFIGGAPGESLAPHSSLEPFLELVDQAARSDILKYRFLGDARRCLLGRMLLAATLSERCELPFRSISYDKSSRGRPYAVHPSFPTRNTFPIDFNVSHDSDLVGVATIPKGQVGDCRVGIDLMKIRNPWEGTTIAEFIEGISEQLTPTERTKIASLSSEESKLSHVLALWTLKEAYVKATGEGLHCDLSQLELDLDLDLAGTDRIGKASFEGVPLVQWEFDLVQLEEGGTGEKYFLAVARNRLKDGEGGVRMLRRKPGWLEFVDFEGLVDKLRSDERNE